MKSNIRYILPVALMGLAACFVSCSEDKLSPDSVITVDKTEQNEFDKWLEVNYVNPYNNRQKSVLLKTENDREVHELLKILDKS